MPDGRSQKSSSRNQECKSLIIQVQTPRPPALFRCRSPGRSASANNGIVASRRALLHVVYADRCDETTTIGSLFLPGSRGRSSTNCFHPYHRIVRRNGCCASLPHCHRFAKTPAAGTISGLSHVYQQLSTSRANHLLWAGKMVTYRLWPPAFLLAMPLSFSIFMTILAASNLLLLHMSSCR